MPFAAPTAQSAIMVAGASLGIVGGNFAQIAMAVAMTCQSQFLLPATMIVTAAGTVGAGVIGGASPPTGVTPPAMASAMYTSMASRGLTGSNNFNICMAISMGICDTIPSLVLFGVSPGVGTGAGTAKAITFDIASFTTTLIVNLASLGIVGSQAMAIAAAIAEGVCTTMTSSLVVPALAIVGPSGPSPATTVFPAQFG